MLTQLYYADFTQMIYAIHYALYAFITQIIYADFTQIIYAIHYADYAIQLRKYDYAIPQNVITQITQILIFITQKFSSLRNGQLADVAVLLRSLRQLRCLCKY